MAVTEEQRHDLYTYYQETMGRERASVVMELLPPVGWGEVATKQDLDHLRTDMRAEFAEVRGEIAGVRAELREQIAGVRAELREQIAGVRAELREQIAEVRGETAGVGAELKGQIADLRAEIADLRAEFHSVMRSSLLTYLGANIALIGTGVGVAKLFLS